VWACVTPMAAVRNASAAAAVTRSCVLLIFMLFNWLLVLLQTSCQSCTYAVQRLSACCVCVVSFMSIQCTNIVPKF
jgi:hypothetical protein